MNTNRLYFASIYVCTEIKDDYDNCIMMFNKKFYGTKTYGNFCKKAIVYHNNSNEYIDIKSGEKYKTSLDNNLKIGDMCINFEDRLIPLNEIPEIKFERKNMSKRKILKKISSASLLSKKEEDK